MTTSFSFTSVRSKIECALHFPINAFYIAACFFAILPFVPFFSDELFQKDIIFIFSLLSFALSFINLCLMFEKNFPFSRPIATLLTIGTTLFIAALTIVFLKHIDEETNDLFEEYFSSIENYCTCFSFSGYWVSTAISVCLKQNGKSK